MELKENVNNINLKAGLDLYHTDNYKHSTAGHAETGNRDVSVVVVSLYGNI